MLGINPQFQRMPLLQVENPVDLSLGYRDSELGVGAWPSAVEYQKKGNTVCGSGSSELGEEGTV